MFKGGADRLSEAELSALDAFLKTLRPLHPEIKTLVRVVPARETTCMRGAEYCILFYSEKKGDYLRNAGYMGEQADLYLNSVGIGALWYGMGKPRAKKAEGLDYVIMIAMAKVPADSFRRDLSQTKRKDVPAIWSGDGLGVSDIVRYAPSACNLQPWFVENDGSGLKVFRVWPAKRGIMPAGKVNFFNRMDIGIFLLILETCLEHEGLKYERQLFEDTSDERLERVQVAYYRLDKSPAQL